MRASRRVPALFGLLPLTLALTVFTEKGGFRHNWLKRYFVLDREKLLYREGKNAGSSIKGTIAVDSIVEARASVSPTPTAVGPAPPLGAPPLAR